MSELEMKVEELERQVEDLGRRVDSFILLSPLEYYLNYIVDKLAHRKYTILWVKEVLEPNLRKGGIWLLPADVDEFLSDGVSWGYVAVHCGHPEARTIYYVVFTSKVWEAMVEKTFVEIYMMCSTCYRMFIRELRKRLNEPMEIPAWDPEAGFKLRVSCKLAIIYSARWWRRRGQRYLIVYDTVSDELGRAAEVVKERLWRKLIAKELRWRRLTPSDRAILKFDIWDQEIDNLIEVLRHG